MCLYLLVYDNKCSSAHSSGPSDDGWKSYTASERSQVVEYLEGLAETPPVSSGKNTSLPILL